MVELRALGPTSLKGPGGTAVQSVLARPRLLALLVTLASAPEGAFLRRDTLLGFFWPDAAQERARASLRQALYNLRQSLGAQAVETRGEDEVRLDPAVVWSDVAAFRAALAGGETEIGLELYRGDLLEGFFLSGASEFERWLDRTRSELRQEAAQAAWHLAEGAHARRNAGAVGHWTRRALALAPFDEARLRKGMVLLAESGDRAGAIQVQVAFARDLEKELGLKPTEETLALAESIASREDRVWAENGEGDHPPPREKVVRPAAAPGRSSPRLGWVTLGATSAIATGLLFVAWASRGRDEPGSDLTQREAPRLPADSISSTVVAVLPFQAHGSDVETDELAAGVHDEILTYLSQVSGLSVLSRRSVGPYGRTDLTPQDIAQRTGAGSVLEGSVQREGSRIRISAQLIDAVTGTNLWAQTYYREPRDVLEVQMEIALRVAGILRARLIYGINDGPVPDSIIEALSRDLLEEILQARPAGRPDSLG